MRLYRRVTEGEIIDSLFFRASKGGGIQLAWRDCILSVRVHRPCRGQINVRLIAYAATEPCACGVGRRKADMRLARDCAICELDLRPDGWWLPRSPFPDADVETMHANLWKLRPHAHMPIVRVGGLDVVS